MIIDQAEIDALLAQAGQLERTVAPADAPADRHGAAARRPTSPHPDGARPPAPPNVERLLRIRVPVIVRLAARKMLIWKIRNLSQGSVIEFNRHVDSPLELLIRNHPIGRGQAVKIGENFGLRVTDIGSAAHRIRSMGR